MKRKYLLILLLFTAAGVSAQERLTKEEKARREKNIEAGNPFKQFGYKAKVATLSKGKYLEVHDLDSVVVIGSVRFHVDRKEIIGFIQPDKINGEYTRPIGDMPSRWLSPDPLAEEFPSWSPYNFVYNNPIRYTDPTGLAPSDDLYLNGEQSAIDKTKETMNQSLGGSYTNVDPNGKVTLNVTPEQVSNFTPEQKAFYDVMNNAIDPSKADVTINVVESSQEVLVGNYNSGTIDIDDVNGFGNNSLSNKSAAFGHEVAEQTQKQREGLPNSPEGFSKAHNGSGIKAENAISGNMRMPGGTNAPVVGTTPGGLPLLSGTSSVRYYNNSNGKTQTLNVSVDNNNVKKVKVN